LPAVFRDRPPHDTIRVWVPGCSTGEEAYSHAICLYEYMTETGADVSLQVFGTDVNEEGIKKARTGIYKENIQKDVSAKRLRRFFTKVKGGYQISKQIRDICVFARQDLITDPPFSHMDIVSCRNVLIYLGPALQRQVIPLLHYALRPGGYLMLGINEGILGTGNDLFETTGDRAHIFRKKDVRSPVLFRLAIPQIELERPNIPLPEPKRPQGFVLTLDPLKEADRLLLKKCGPSAAVVDEHMEILQAYGHTGRYLELPKGKPSLNMLRMASRSLSAKLKTMITAAYKRNQPIVQEHMSARSNGTRHMVDVEVIPFKADPASPAKYLVVFREPRSAGAATHSETSTLRKTMAAAMAGGS
jgi:two-component system, chemotaxis family, CheB/CheR fusion protein